MAASESHDALLLVEMADVVSKTGTRESELGESFVPKISSVK